MLYGIPARMPWLALGETPYHEPWPPRAIDAAEAGVLESAATLADREAATRRSMAAQLTAILACSVAVSLIRTPTVSGTIPGWLRFPVLLDSKTRERAGESAFRRLGIIPGYPSSLPRLPNLVVRSGETWSGAERLVRSLVTLPAHRWVTEKDRAEVARLLSPTP